MTDDEMRRKLEHVSRNLGAVCDYLLSVDDDNVPFKQFMRITGSGRYVDDVIKALRLRQPTTPPTLGGDKNER